MAKGERVEKYLYLPETEFVETWVNGGEIPLNLASTYRRAERDGKYTPDENLIYRSSVNLKIYEPFLEIGQAVNLTIIDPKINGRPAPSVFGAMKLLEDGLVFCCSNSFSKKIAAGLNSKACVRIFEISKLKDVFDKQLGIEGVMGICKYTDGHERDHFLKSTKDDWQDEFRIFWDIKEAKWVHIPAGLAEEVPL